MWTPLAHNNKDEVYSPTITHLLIVALTNLPQMAKAGVLWAPHDTAIIVMGERTATLANTSGAFMKNFLGILLGDTQSMQSIIRDDLFLSSYE